MTNYLTFKKIIMDCVALYKSHFLYITILIGSVLVPYSFLVRKDDLPDQFVLIIPIFILLMMLVEAVSIGYVSTGYIERDFNMFDEIKLNLKKVLPYTLITTLGAIATFFGLSVLVLPGVIATLFFNLLKVDYIVENGNLATSTKRVLNSLKGGYFFKILRIYILPTLLQFIISLVITPFFNPETLEEDLFRLYPYITAALIIVFPISVVFKASVYFNLLKDRQLNSSNELV